MTTIDSNATRSASRTAPSPTRSRRHLVTAMIYAVLAVVGLVGTWYFNFQFTDPDGLGYVQSWFVNPASSSVAVDVIVTAVVACVFIVVESLRLRWRWTLILLPLTFFVALAFTLPLFLALRELAIGRRAAINSGINSGIKSGINSA